MTDTGGEKLAETPPVVTAPQGPSPASAADTSTESAPWRLFTPSPKTVRHIVVEVLIVAVGVFIALGVDQLRQYWTQRAQAHDTRELLRAEVQRNLESIEQGLQGIADLYAVAASHPDEAPVSVMDLRRSLTIQFSTAYDMALQTGAFAYLDAEERRNLAEVYRRQELLNERSRAYFEATSELASFPTGKLDSADETRDRSRQLRRWQLAARAMFGSQCRQMVRNRIGLGEKRPDGYENEFCLAVHPMTTDVEALIAGRNVQKAPVAPAEPEAPT